MFPDSGGLRTGAVGTDQNHEVIDIDHPVAIEITEAGLWTVAAGTVAPKPVTEVVGAVDLGSIRNATTGKAAHPDLHRGRAVAAFGTCQPVSASVCAIINPSEQATVAEAACARVRTVGAVHTLAKPLAAECQALVFPNHAAA